MLQGVLDAQDLHPVQQLADAPPMQLAPGGQAQLLTGPGAGAPVEVRRGYPGIAVAVTTFDALLYCKVTLVA